MTSDDILFLYMETKSSELYSNIPLLENIANSIKQTGTFEQALNGQDIEQIMKGTISGLLSNQENINADFPKMDVNIENNQGKINGTVIINKPISASIEIDCILGNSNKENELDLISLKINEKAKFLAKMALAAVDIEGKAKEALRNPNKALFDSLSKQLEPKNVSLTDIGLHFNNNALKVSLLGKTT